MMCLLVIIIFVVTLYIFNRLTCGVCKTYASLVGKTAIVTGGNSGIGYEVVKNLASRGCRVIIADKDNAETSRKKIIKETNNPNIVTKYLNLACFKSVREFAEDINKTEKALHILINNAGVGLGYPLVTEDELNATMQINHYGPFLLTHLLIDLMKKSTPSRIIFTSSAFAYFSNLKETDMIKVPSNISTLDGYRIYSDSKLCQLITANEFAKKLNRTGITSNSLHPGHVRTTLFQKSFENSIKSKIIVWSNNVLGFIVGKNSWEGSQSTVFAATAPELENVTGKHFWDCKEFPFHPIKAYNPNFCMTVWKLSEKCTGLKDYEIL